MNPGPRLPDHVLIAAAYDNTDPHLAARLATHARVGVGQQYDYSRTRRQRAPIEDRFTLYAPGSRRETSPVHA